MSYHRGVKWSQTKQTNSSQGRFQTCHQVQDLEFKEVVFFLGGGGLLASSFAFKHFLTPTQIKVLISRKLFLYV